MSNLKKYYFEKIGCGGWQVYDEYGSGDMILLKGDVLKYVTPTLAVGPVGPAGVETFTTPVSLKIEGFSPLSAVIKLFVQEGILVKVQLSSLHELHILNSDVQRFSLVIPYFQGTLLHPEDE